MLACLAALLSQCRWCCCLSRCVGVGLAREVRQRFAGQVTGHQVESFMSACVDARLFHYVPMLLFDLFRASPCWLAALRGGAFGLAALGSCKKSCSSCFADASERGVQVAVLLLFEARRSGYCVGVCGGIKDNPAFLVLAFSTP